MKNMSGDSGRPMGSASSESNPEKRLAASGLKVMLLAAGLGTRLHPLTLERAKPALPLLGRPVILRIVEKLLRYGCSAFRVNLHHLPHTVERIFERGPGRCLPVSFAFEPEILGTAGGLKANQSFFDQGTFLMVNGKIVMEFPLDEAIAFHREQGALATLVLFPQQAPHRHWPIRIDDKGHLVGFKGSGSNGTPRPETYAFTGIHVLEPDIFEFIPPGVFYEINDKVYPDAIRRGLPICGFPVEGYWNDLSTPARYLEAQRDLLQFHAASPPCYVSPAARVAESAVVGPFASVEDGCVLEVGSRVENSILWENVRLETGSSVSGCIIGAGLTVTGHHIDKIITLAGEAPIV